ncbi:MAG: signal peptidase I [Deltaproteobacteria bacterium]|nr:MAG: signal peptidase I [Deltaproteobacteria bacterium]
MVTVKRAGKGRSGKIGEAVKEWTKSLLIAFVLAFILKATVVQSYEIPTGSMEPTIMPGDRVLGSRLVYFFREPIPGEIITFTPPDCIPRKKTNILGQTIPFVKRVIAVGGDIIEVRNGQVYRNSVSLNEPYIMRPTCYDLPPTRVPEGKLFVLGDNRCNSLDSHIWGFLSRDNIKAKAVFRYWPPSRIGIVK